MSQTQETGFGNITSANSTLILTVAKVHPAGVTLQQFATDQSVSMDEVTMAETRLGVDGFLAAGWIPGLSPVTVMLEASSPSYEACAQVYSAQTQSRTLYECSLVARVPSLGKVFEWSGGVMKSGTIFPSHKKVLDPTSWKFEFAKLKISKM